MICSYHYTSQQVYQNHIWENNTLSEKRLFFLYSIGLDLTAGLCVVPSGTKTEGVELRTIKETKKNSRKECKVLKIK